MYIATFASLQYAYCTLVEYVCRDGHRIRCREVVMDWQTNFCWC